jgi:hypothetical protein
MAIDANAPSGSVQSLPHRNTMGANYRLVKRSFRKNLDYRVRS